MSEAPTVEDLLKGMRDEAEQVTKMQQTITRLRQQLKETRKHLKNANKGAELNAKVSQGLARECNELRQQAKEDSDLIEAQKREILVLQEMQDACLEYLKEGETPAECIERWRNDAQRMLKILADVADDAARYRWGLERPSLMANYFIKWKTKHDRYNHRNPGVHPSTAIDAARAKEMKVFDVMNTQEKAKWLADFYEQIAQGGIPQFRAGAGRGYFDATHGPNMRSIPDNWRIKPHGLSGEGFNKELNL